MSIIAKSAASRISGNDWVGFGNDWVGFGNDWVGRGNDWVG